MIKNWNATNEYNFPSGNVGTAYAETVIGILILHYTLQVLGILLLYRNAAAPCIAEHTAGTNQPYLSKW